MDIDTSLLKSKSIFPIVSPFSYKICSIARSPSVFQTFITWQEKIFCLLILQKGISYTRLLDPVRSHQRDAAFVGRPHAVGISRNYSLCAAALAYLIPPSMPQMRCNTDAYVSS